MPRLLMYKENQVESILPLGQGSIAIGREHDNDIQLKDPSVSQHHAKIVSFFKPTYIQDLRSTNGTYVNGKRIMKHTLQQGDEIMIGSYTHSELRETIRDYTTEYGGFDFESVLDLVLA